MPAQANARSENPGEALAQGRPARSAGRQHIAVIGSGIAGLSAAWLLAQKHHVTLLEADARPGGHSDTVQLPGLGHGGSDLAVDSGFIVYNEKTYPNLSALFQHLGVATTATEMGFAVSLDGGRLEYSGSGLGGLLAQPGNLLRPRFWTMLRELLRFYREAPLEAAQLGWMSLDAYLDQRGYGPAFRHDHLYPMAAAIWSTPANRIGQYPVAALVRFCENHNLLDLGERPAWRTVVGGSREYVQRMCRDLGEGLRTQCPVKGLRRDVQGVQVLFGNDTPDLHVDQVVVATHADQALRLLDKPSAQERELLGAFAYTRNRAVVHTDRALMPRRRRAWASWNYLAEGQGSERLCVTYWMNALQPLATGQQLFVTLNPIHQPAADTVLREAVYEHPVFDVKALQAQERLWTLQGQQRTWYCGAYFGSGFHEDGLQAGLAVAEALGGVRRPWQVANESGRIHLDASLAPGQAAA